MEKRTFFLLACIFVLGLVAFGSNHIVNADVNVNVNIVPPPPLVVHAPPPVVVIPGTYVYFPPGVDVDILFYQGYWYRMHHGHWYRSRVYNGKWIYINPPRVPGVLLRLPPNYRAVPPGHRRIPYAEVKKNWKTWEREKHWDKHEQSSERWDKPEHHEREEHRDAGREHGGPNKGKGKH